MARLRQVDPRKYVERGTSVQVIVAFIVACLGILFFVGQAARGGLVGMLVAIGILTVFLVGNWIVYLLRLKTLRAGLHGSAVKISRKQLADIHEMADEIAEAMDIETPDIYVVESNQLNASAVSVGAKHYVVLIDDLIHGTQIINNPDALRWIIAHELAHHALGHTGMFRSQLRSIYTPLSRLDELSCDAVASAVVGKQAGYDALKLLTIGPHLYSQVNDDALDRQALQVNEDKNTKKAENMRTHPLILRRLARMVPESAD